MTSSRPAPLAAPGRRRLKRVLRPLAGGRAYALLHSAAKAWDIRSGRWLEPELGLVPHLLAAGETAVDVGANFGLWTYHLSRAAGPRGSVLALEPVPFSAAALRRVVRLLGLRNVTVVEQGLSDVPGRVRFVLPLQESGVPNAGLAHLGSRDDARGGGDRVAAGEADEIICEVVRLDDLGVSGDLAFLKCDVEGAELLALRGAEATLARHAPTLLLEVDPWFLEGFGFRPGDLLDFLSVRGYAAYRYAAGRLRPASAADLPGNLLFVHPRRAGRLAALLP